MCKIVFATDRDAEMRLQSSVVMYKGEPVYVLHARQKVCTVCHLGVEEEIKVKVCDLDLEPVVFGNIQVGDSYTPAQRAPSRRWKQGLDKSGVRLGKMPWEAVRWNMNSKEALNAIIDNYPSAVDAIGDVLSGRKKSVAFSKRWGVGSIKTVPHLFYKDKKVGVADEGELVLFPKFFYLKEDILGVLNG